MKLEQQVCSLELAKRLKELGVRLDGAAFFWIDDRDNGKHELFYRDMWHCGCDMEYHQGCDIDEIADEREDAPGKFDPTIAYIAFTAAELGEMLPHGIFYVQSAGGAWSCEFADGKRIGYSDTEADARAKMLIYLIEKGIVKP